MSEKDIFEVPPVVVEHYQKLYDLVQNKSENGRIKVKDLAEYLGRTENYVSDLIKNRYAPYAYSDGSSARAVAQIGVLPLYQFEMQNGVLVDLKQGFKK